MCRALKVLCAAPDRERLLGLKRASVGVHWELVGGALSVRELAAQLELHRPDVVVFDSGLGDDAVSVVRRVQGGARLVAVGAVPGVDAVAEGPAAVRDAIMGIPRTGGPVTA